MDRDEALRLLRGGEEGVREWNRRRRAGEAIPDLTGADLHGADLHGADLTEASLDGARLDWARLSGASLNGTSLDRASLDRASLDRANLDGARLDRASLDRASLNGASLDEASLNGASLHEANLDGARLDRASLAGAICGGTLFADVDLSEIEGLESVQHHRPSEIGVGTLIRSKGKIPEVFLRGCGVPEVLIAYLPSLIGSMSPIQFSSCFISYSTKDEAFAQRLHSRMCDEGLRVWLAPEDVPGGKKLHEPSDEAIRVFDKLLLVLSPNSMNSAWVKTEIRQARKIEIEEGQRKLFPIGLVDFETLRDWECFDADSGTEHDAFEEGFARLLRDLKAEDRAAP
jgi:hypothetical protein